MSDQLTFYLTTHSTHFIYGYIVCDMIKTTEIVRKETHQFMGSFILAARDLLYGSSHRQDNTSPTFVAPATEHWLELINVQSTRN